MNKFEKELQDIKQARKDEIMENYLQRIEEEAKLSRMTPEERYKYLSEKQLKSIQASEKKRMEISEGLNNDRIDARMSRAEEHARKAMAEMEVNERKRKAHSESVWQEKQKRNKR
ncbi:hypothetical protein [Jeotgalibacillus malaysiensis]|uniref:hypothetical protein n=1 Tax=Jeotgalibacillus malaysiensis TaxID=1508404 RepID=UPI00384B286F